MVQFREWYVLMMQYLGEILKLVNSLRSLKNKDVPVVLA